MHLDNRTKALISLMCDEDRDISANAMAQLLAIDAEADSDTLAEILSELQESNEPIIRKKAHQMQAIQRIRRRRRNFSRRMKTHSPNLLQGLAELHSIWYDDLDAKDLSKLWADLMKEAVKVRPVTPKRLATFMKASGFATCDENIQDADLYCLGAIIEDRIGSDILLSAIALEAGKTFGLQGTIVKLGTQFGIMYTTKNESPTPTLQGVVIMPARRWEIIAVPEDREMEVWTTKQVLKYVTAMLFVNSVCSEGPRYIQILAACLVDKNANESMEELLPAPFGSSSQ